MSNVGDLRTEARIANIVAETTILYACSAARYVEAAGAQLPVPLLDFRSAALLPAFLFPSSYLCSTSFSVER